MKWAAAIAVALVVAAVPIAFGQHRQPAFALPDSVATPGALNKFVTQANIRTTICDARWRALQRPPERLSARMKESMLHGRDPKAYQMDHAVPLALGGAAYSSQNLWLQPVREARVKDELELFLSEAACDGKISLVEAQECIRLDWVGCYRKQIGPLP